MNAEAYSGILIFQACGDSICVLCAVCCTQAAKVVGHCLDRLQSSHPHRPRPVAELPNGPLSPLRTEDMRVPRLELVGVVGTGPWAMERGRAETSFLPRDHSHSSPG